MTIAQVVNVNCCQLLLKNYHIATLNKNCDTHCITQLLLQKMSNDLKLKIKFNLKSEIVFSYLLIIRNIDFFNVYMH